jgi:hypothetical protein
MNLIPILFAILVAMIAFFFSSDFQASLAAFPGLSTGLVAVLTVLTTGVISTIVKIIDIEHAKSERRNQRSYTIIDEKYKVIIAGINAFEVQFQKYGGEIVSIFSDYSPNLNAAQLEALVPPRLQVSEQMPILLSEIASLKDEELDRLFFEVLSAWSNVVVSRKSLLDLLQIIIENPKGKRPENLDAVTPPAEFSKTTNDFLTFVGACKRRLAQLRIAELEKPT